MPLTQVPQSNQNLAQTQNPILQNFNTINNNFLVNHVELGTAGAGKHKFLQMPEQSSPPTTVADEAGFYAAQGVVSTVTELYFRRESNATPIPMTEMKALSATNGWSFLPSGIIMQWGQVTMNGGVSQLDFTLPRAFPTTFYSITATPDDTPSGNFTDIILAVQKLSLNQGRAKRKQNFGTACTFNFLAIGI